MTHGRKPRKPRVINVNTFGTALYRAARLTDAEVRETIAPAQACLDRLREGVATEDQHTVLATCLQIAMEIERSGIVRGLREHIAAAQAAMDSIRARALASGAWRPTALYFHELDALRDAVEFHEFQLRQVSSGELTAMARKLIARTQSTGGTAVRTDMTSLGLQAA